MPQKPPAFQFYAKDWTSSPQVNLMSMHHRGVYITTLAASWESEEPGTLPLPIEIAAKLCRCDPRSLRDFVAKWPRCWVEVGSKLVNKKLRENWLNYKEISEIRRKAAESRHHANASQNDQSSSSPAFASALNTNTKTKEQKPKTAPLALPVWIPLEAWTAYIEMRGRIRKPMTSRARELAIKKLESLNLAGHKPLDVLNQSVFNCWQGLFEVKSNGNGNGHRVMLTAQEQAGERMKQAARNLELEEEKNAAKRVQ